jgi:3,5-epimerase/4-reductase
VRGKILILGKGFIGNRLQGELQSATSGKKILSYSDIDKEIKKFKPEILINCIGHLGSNVDECEKDLDKTLTANSFVPIILAEAAIRNNIKLIHIGSGCIYHYNYSKDIPINEDKIPDFFELFYSRSKIYSEQALSVLSRRYPILIIRIRVPLDNQPHPRNLLTKLINYKKIIEIPNSVTYIPDFINALKHLIKINATGIYNVVNKEPLIYSDLMKVYKKYVPSFKYEVIDYRNLPTRTNLILSTDKLENSGFKVKTIHEVLEECVKSYLKYS